MDSIKLNKADYIALMERLARYETALENVLEIVGEVSSTNQCNRIYDVTKKAFLHK